MKFVKLSEIADVINGKMIRTADQVDENYDGNKGVLDVIGISNLRGGEFDLSNMSRIIDNNGRIQRSYELQHGDLILASRFTPKGGIKSAVYDKNLYGFGDRRSNIIPDSNLIKIIPASNITDDVSIISYYIKIVFESNPDILINLGRTDENSNNLTLTSGKVKELEITMMDIKDMYSFVSDFRKYKNDYIVERNEVEIRWKTNRDKMYKVIHDIKEV